MELRPPVLKFTFMVSAALGGLTLLAASQALAQTTPALINPISTFAVQEGSNSVSWSQTGATTDSTSGNSIISFQDVNGGTSTMTWLSTGVLSNWTINVAGGGTQVFTDGIVQGEVGSFLLTSGTLGTNPVLSINGHSYVPTGNFLQPAYQGSEPSPNLMFVYPSTITFGGSVYTFVKSGTTYSNMQVGTFSNGTNSFTLSETNGLQFYLANGTCAYYAVDPAGRTYTYQANSTAPNSLTQVNGLNLTINGNVVLLPLPVTSFVVNGTTYTFSSIWWNALDFLTRVGPGISYYFNGSSAYGGCDSSGNLAYLDLSAAYLTRSGPGVYQLVNSSGSVSLSAINGVPYVKQGNNFVAEGPVNGFSYAGNNYSFTGFSVAGDGNWLAQYSTGGTNPVTGTVEYSPTNDAIVKMSINAAGGGTAYYVDGATVGQPGAYVWSSTSTAANALSAVNNATFNSSGNSDLPSTATTTNGVFKISGNFLSLGSWSTNANQSGFDLSYYDGQSSYPALIEFTANRPLSSWSWDAATADGTAVNPVMQLDQASRLLLYPVAGQNGSGATGPIPSVILDPFSATPSEFSGVVRFDGAVRIAPQGDLSMGPFTQDAFPPQPNQ